MPSPFHWGILGLGNIAAKFAIALEAIPEARLSAVASRDQDRAAAFAQQHGAPHAYGSYADLLTCPELDAVYIATRHVSHAELSVMCLRAGIPVLCEKPWAMHADEARYMVDTAQQHKTFLMEAIWTRFLPTTQKVLELLQSDAIGRIVGLKADFGFRTEGEKPVRLFDPALGGGALLDIGIYPVFLAQLLLGDPVNVKAMSVLSPRGIDLDTGVVLRYPGEVLAHLHCTLQAKTKTEAFIYGEKGTIHIHTRWHEPTSLSLLRIGERPELFHFDYVSNGYNYEAEAVMRCVAAHQTECPELPLDFSLRLTMLLDRIRAEAGIVYPGDPR